MIKSYNKIFYSQNLKGPPPRVAIFKLVCGHQQRQALQIALRIAAVHHVYRHQLQIRKDHRQQIEDSWYGL